MLPWGGRVGGEMETMQASLVLSCRFAFLLCLLGDGRLGTKRESWLRGDFISSRSSYSRGHESRG